jgi:phenylpyruvate tautomerase PptA (4-oxalocrotonate tautomerase family)
MPLVRIDMQKGRDARAISDAVHRALVEVMGVPERDRFQIVTQHDALVFDSGYLEIRRESPVFIHVTLSAGRDVPLKQKFYARCAELVSGAGVRPQDVTIVLVENRREDWSFGEGEAQYVVRPREQWR